MLLKQIESLDEISEKDILKLLLVNQIEIIRKLNLFLPFLILIY